MKFACLNPINCVHPRPNVLLKFQKKKIKFKFKIDFTKQHALLNHYFKSKQIYLNIITKKKKKTHKLNICSVKTNS